MVDETLGARIRRIREAREKTQDQLAAGCAAFGRTVSRTMIQHWECDQHAPTSANFAALARVLGVSMDVLFYGEEEAARITAEGAGGSGRQAARPRFYAVSTGRHAWRPVL